MSYQTLNKQIQYPLSGSFTGSFNGTATTASYVAWGNIGGNINNQNDLSGSLSNGNTAFSWGNHANAGYALTSSLAGYVPYVGATTNLNLGANSLIFSAATGAGRIKLPDAGTTSTDGIAFGDFFIFRSALQTISLQSSSATWTINAAILGAPTNQNSIFRIGGSRTLTFDNGVGGTIMSLNSSSGTTTIRGNSPTTNSVVVFQNSTPTDILTVANNGDTTFAGGGAVNISKGLRMFNAGSTSSGLLISDNTTSGGPGAGWGASINMNGNGRIHAGNSASGWYNNAASDVSFGRHTTNTWGVYQGQFSTTLGHLTLDTLLPTKISFGTNTGTSLINFPDANSSTNGINFGNNVLLYQGTSPVLFTNSSLEIGTSGLVLTATNIYRNGSGFEIGRYGGGGNVSFYANNTTLVQTMFSSTGNVSIGTTSDLARLAVQGNSAVSGLAFQVLNSTPGSLFTVDNTGKIGLRPTNFELWFGTIDNASYANLKQVSGVLTLQAPNNSSTINLNGGIIGDYLTGANVYGVNITNVVNTRTITGTYSLLRLFQYISPTSGISNTNFLEISGTIQQTGGANGITRGILIAPTLTAASNYIGIESNGRIQIGLPTLNSWSSYAYSGRYVNAGIYLEGANSPIDLRLQATNLSGGNGVVQLLAGNNNNSYLLLGLTYLRESGGNLFIGTTNTAPSATLHARGNSPTANHVFQLENSSTNLLFRVANNGDILFGATGQVLYVGSSGLLRFGVSATNNYIAGFSGASNGITISGGGTGFGTRFVRSEITNSTSGTFTGIALEVNNGFQPTSGNASLTMIQVTGQINQTGTATGITKGINIKQALTSTIDYRAIEAITGNSPTHTLIKLNNGSTDVFCVKGDKTIIMNIPTSSAGLPSGALWNDSGTLKIV